MTIPVTMSSLDALNTRLEKEPEWWVDACARMAEGVPYWEIAGEMYVKPALFRGWIGGDKDRERDFQAAMAHRAEYRNEKAAARLAEFVDAGVKADDVNPAHVLKAIESTLGKGGVGVKVDANITIIHESA